ncbi:MAG: glutathione S-transferase family protein [Alphaproteobacteria bacterium]|nr:glutathione S-transferase family protein [Alphaproteobacteria bacterium]
MKMYNSIGPNPHMVRMFIAEKGLDIPMEDIDIMAGVNRQGDFLKINPQGQCPALITDSGDLVSEITAICEYLEELNPTPSLIGGTPAERAETRMWTRRIDINICEPMANGFRYGEGLKLFESRIRCLPEASDGLKAVAQDGLAALDGQMAGKTWVCGDRFSMADILLFSWTSFFSGVGQALIPDHKNIAAWFERAKARPSALA